MHICINAILNIIKVLEFITFPLENKEIYKLVVHPTRK